MRVFISWSGERSRQIASTLKDWLPLVLHFAEPWMSDADIHAGQRWSAEIGRILQDANVGILCITRENVGAPWLLFEAGALSKSLKEGAVLPYLLDVQFGDINNSPIGQFQAKKADKKGTLELVVAINVLSKDPVPPERLERLFERFWPDLEEALTQLGTEKTEQAPVRSSSEILEELVSAVRDMSGRLARVERLGSIVPTIIANDEPEYGAEVEAVRTRVRERLESTSLKQIARDTSLTPTAVDAFIKGAPPSASTFRALRRYMSGTRVSADSDPVDAHEPLHSGGAGVEF